MVKIRAVAITFFLMVFFLTLSVFTTVVPEFASFDIAGFDAGQDVSADAGSVEQEIESMADQSYAQMDEIRQDSGILQVFATVLYGIKMFLGVVLNTLRYMILFYPLMLSYGVPFIIASLIQTLIWFNYVIAIAQMFNLWRARQ